MERSFTVSVFTESQVGVLNRLVDTLSRRRLPVDSLTSCECEVPGVYRHTIVLAATRDQIRKVVKQIEKTGHEDDTRELLDRLEPFGVMEFARSGRVAITKPTRTLLSYFDKSNETRKGEEN